MQWLDPPRQGFALPLVLTSSALLLLSSLSLQTLALHGRQRSAQLFATAQFRDAEHSVVMLFRQHLVGVYACLLALPSSEWERSEQCPGVNASALQSGWVAGRLWHLVHWQPRGASAGTLLLRWSDDRQSHLLLEPLP